MAENQGIGSNTPPSSSSPTDSIVHLNVPISTKLNSTNHLTWICQILPLINGYNLSSHITTPPPSKKVQSTAGLLVDNPDFDRWNRQDQFLLGWIRSSLTESILGQTSSSKTTLDLWQSLQCSFSSVSRARTTDLRRQLQTTTKGGSTCFDYLQKMKKIADELSFVGSAIPEDDLVTYVLNGLGSNYTSFVISLTTSARNDPISFSDLQGSLFNFENLISSHHQLPQTQVSLPSLSNPSAMYTRYPASPGNNRSGYNRSNRPQTQY